ncbi:hypothetical protein GCK32_016405 [Trichostrongylus colubriformis]|uniref:DUF1758 domain-containing protein n=1 Tax=Trichostrongylus colubriformis TaxID=6319 RepID=A0AAN8F3U3_TRICO
MAGTATAEKGWATKRRTAAAEWLRATQGLLREEDTIAESSRKDCMRELRRCLMDCGDHLTLQEKVLGKFTRAYDELKEHSEEDDKKFSEYISCTHDTIWQLSERTSALKRALMDLSEESESQQTSTGMSVRNSSQPLSSLSVRAFAEQLGLQVIDKVTLHIGTFGSAEPTKKTCSISTLQLCDAEGRYHDLRVYRNDFITTLIKQADLNQRDLAFIQARDLQLSLSVRQSLLQPNTLLGCDYLWTFIEDTKHHQLASGLKLIPTRLGCVISGREQDAIPPHTRVLTIQGRDIDANATETELWDRYWSPESTGTEEYTGPQKTEHQQINEKVIEDFKKTVRHREDGYYVRLL